MTDNINWSDIKSLFEYIFDNQNIEFRLEHYKIISINDDERHIVYEHEIKFTAAIFSRNKDGFIVVYSDPNAFNPQQIIIPYDLDDIQFTLENGRINLSLFYFYRNIKRCLK